MGLQALATEFLEVFRKGDYEAAATFLPKIKLALAEAGLLVITSDSLKKGGKSAATDLEAARQLLEIAVLTSVHNRDEQEMGRLIAQVRPLYNRELGLSVSENENRILALQLLLLVAKSEIAEFHTELETLYEENPEHDKYLSYPILLERWLMEGSYDKVWKAITDNSQVPSPEFAILAESLVQTVRSEIASCLERAYDSLPIQSTRHLLFLSSNEDILEFVANHQPTWVVQNGVITFPSEDVAASEEADVAADKLIENTLEYTRQIETII